MKNEVKISDKKICFVNEYKLFSDVSHEKKVRLILKLMGDKTGKILDIGCYKGGLFEAIKNDGNFEYFGMDVKKFNPNIKNFSQQDLNKNTKLPFATNSFDVVVCVDVLEHLFYPDKISKEINRILKPNGILIVSLPNEFYFMKRLKFLFGVNFFRFGYYDHHWLFDFNRAKLFLSQFFNISVIHPFFIIPKTRIENHSLPKLFPTLFSNWIFFVCRPKKSGVLKD